MELRELLKQNAPILSPGCFDVLSALLVEQAGFPSVSISGAAVTAAAMGLPDRSFLGAEELAQLVNRITSVVRIPVFVDCESGFGSVLTAIRTAALMEKLGAACVCFQDKQTDRTLLDPRRMAGLLKGASEARRGGGMMLMARTDALATEGLERTVERCRRYVDSGAELLFVNGLETPLQMEQIARAGLGVPLKFNNTIKKNGSQYSAQELYGLGFQIIAYSASLQKAAVKAMQTVLKQLHDTGKTQGCLSMAITQQERAQLLGDAIWQAREEKYSGQG